MWFCSRKTLCSRRSIPRPSTYLYGATMVVAAMPKPEMTFLYGVEVRRQDNLTLHDGRRALGAGRRVPLVSRHLLRFMNENAVTTEHVSNLVPVGRFWIRVPSPYTAGKEYHLSPTTHCHHDYEKNEIEITWPPKLPISVTSARILSC